MATNQEFVKELADRYKVNYEQSDVNKLDDYGAGANRYRDLQQTNGGVARPESDWQQAGISTPQQYEDFKKALEVQYQQRGSSNGQPNDGGSTPPPSGGGNNGGGGTPSNAPPAQQWNDSGVSQAINQQNSLIQQQMAMMAERQKAADAQEAARGVQRDQLYGQLQVRANQATQINANDPIIKGQVDVYRAEQDRAQRNYLSDTAEGAGPFENLRGEQRMAAERTGQAVGGFQAELLGRELGARRAEIADALNSMRGILTGDQQANLSRELSTLDKQMQGLGLSGQNASLTSQNALGFGNLGLGYANMGLQRDLGFAGLDLQRTLGLGGLDVQREGYGVTRRGQDLSMDQFLRELAQRQWNDSDQSQYRWANL
jgi:hypothetical protein